MSKHKKRYGLTIADIASRLKPHAESICRELLPNGKINRGEYEVGSVFGEEGQSLRIRLEGQKAGVWSDFASGDVGGDLVDLIAAVRETGIAEAMKWAKNYLGIKDETPTLTTSKKKAFVLPRKPKCTVPKSEVKAWLESRGLTEDTIKLFKIGETPDYRPEVGGMDVVFPSFHGDVLKLVKHRPVANKEKIYTSKDSEPILFGWQAVDSKSRYVIITEGELDAMSYRQQGFAALSIPYGAGSNRENLWIDVEYDNLSRFDKIYLSFDNDETGQKCLMETLPRLGAHRCLIPDLGPHKDANEAMMAGYDLAGALQRAISIDPEELKTSEEFHDATMAEFYAPPESKGTPMPWEKTRDKIRVRQGEISVWNGINGHGKSLMIGQVAVNSIYNGEKWCFASMEMSPPRLLARMYRQSGATNKPTYEHGDAIRDFLCGYVWLFNVRGTAKGERIIEVFEYAYHRYGCKQFLVDSLAKCGFNEDDYSGQKAFVDRLMEFAAQYNVHVHLVVHARKAESEDLPPNKMDVKGSGAITDMVDNVFTVWRNKPKETALASKDEAKKSKFRSEPDALLCCYKQRNGEWEGRVNLWFEPASLQYVETADSQPLQYVNGEVIAPKPAVRGEYDEVPF